MSLGAAPPGMDEYQRLMAERASAQRRNRLVMGTVVTVAVVAGGIWWTKEKKKAAAAQEILDAGGRFAEKDKTEMGAFWNCVTSSEVDVGSFQSADQIQQRIESAYFTQQKTFSEHLTTECVPKIERARQVLSAMTSEMPEALKAPFDKYVATLPGCRPASRATPRRSRDAARPRTSTRSIQEIGGAFTADVSPESVAFEKFMVCAIPDLDKKKDIQGVLEFLADICKKDPVKFMTGVREKCGPLVQNVNKDAKPEPSKTFKANAKKFFEEDQRQLQAWEYCAKRSRKGKKVLDLEEFLTAASDYVESRGEVGKTALDTRGAHLGQAGRRPQEGRARPAAE